MINHLTKRPPNSTQEKPLAVIIKGNPKYIDDPKIKPLAEAFYSEIRKLLEAKGFRVTFDPGAEYTLPDRRAKVWIAHSRGIDRLRFVPKSIQKIALRTKDKGNGGYKGGFDQQGHDPLHYQLSDSDRQAIADLHL